jgi:hypothetical protein
MPTSSDHTEVSVRGKQTVASSRSLLTILVCAFLVQSVGFHQLDGARSHQVPRGVMLCSFILGPNNFKNQIERLRSANIRYY